MNSLDDLYREVILDHYRNPRNRGEMEVPPAVRAEGFNPLCGDEIVVYIVLDEDGRISELTTGGQGCSISQSSASMMSMAVKGKTVDEVRRLTHAFKSMMSIHGNAIGGDHHQENDDVEEDDDPSPIRLGDLEALRGVVRFPVRIKCATLCWNTLQQALEDNPDQQP